MFDQRGQQINGQQYNQGKHWVTNPTLLDVAEAVFAYLDDQPDLDRRAKELYNRLFDAIAEEKKLRDVWL